MLTIITKSSTLDVAAALGPPLDVVYSSKERSIQNPVKCMFSQVWNRRPPSHTSFFWKCKPSHSSYCWFTFSCFFDPPFLNTAWTIKLLKWNILPRCSIIAFTKLISISKKNTFFQYIKNFLEIVLVVLTI